MMLFARMKEKFTAIFFLIVKLFRMKLCQQAGNEVNGSDGTMYKGNTPILEASDFIIYLRSQQIPHLFVTNNSTAKAEDVSDKLNQMDIPADKNQIVTSAVACASYIKSEKEQASV